MIDPAPPAARADGSLRNISAALFAALFQALAHCPPEHRPAILEALESRLNSVFDDLTGKLELLLASGTSPLDRVQGLWLLYLCFVTHPRGDVQIWIGPDLFGEDTDSHLRILWPTGQAEASSVLREDLEILARAVHSSARITLHQPGPGQLVVVLQDATLPAC